MSKERAMYIFGGFVESCFGVGIYSCIAATNTSASDVTFTISLNGAELQSATTIPANITAYIDLKQVMNAGDILAGGASSTSVNLHVSGVEIS